MVAKGITMNLVARIAIFVTTVYMNHRHCGQTQRAMALSQFSSSIIDFIRNRNENALDRICNQLQEDMFD